MDFDLIFFVIFVLSFFWLWLTISDFMTLKDENLLELFRTDENQAFKILYERYRDGFQYRVQKSNSAITRDDAIDIFQDSLIILYDKIMKQEVETLDNPGAYLNRVGQLLIYERLRKRKKAVEIAKEIYADIQIKLTEYDFLDSDEDGSGSFLSTALKSLSQSCRDLIIAYYYRSLSFEEIAIEANYKNPNTVKSQKFKCISQLRKVYNAKRG